jgi:uncharacterized protein (DUF3820 family)
MWLFGEYKMRTTLDLPEDLLKKAMSLSQIKTKTQVINHGITRNDQEV